jgi:hypothetical protein
LRALTGWTAIHRALSFGDMRDMGVRGVLIYCADYHCSHSIAVMADYREISTFRSQ